MTPAQQSGAEARHGRVPAPVIGARGALDGGSEEWRWQRISARSAGEDLATVQRLLGHELLETTAIYTQPTARDLEQAVRRLEAEPED